MRNFIIPRLIHARSHDFNYFLQFDRTIVLPAVLLLRSCITERLLFNYISYNYIFHINGNHLRISGCPKAAPRLFRSDSNILPIFMSEIINHEEAKLGSSMLRVSIQAGTGRNVRGKECDFEVKTRNRLLLFDLISLTDVKDARITQAATRKKYQGWNINELCRM